MNRIAQIVTATGFVNAVVRAAAPLTAPAGMTFMELSEESPDVCGWTWNGSAFVPPPEQEP